MTGISNNDLGGDMPFHFHCVLI